MRIVLLAVDDEFAGEMQRALYERHPEWIVGSVISSCEIFKHSKLSALWFVLRTSGLVFLLEMVRIKIVRRLLERKRRVLPSQLAAAAGVETLVMANINAADAIARLRALRPDLIISTNFSHYLGKTVRESIAAHGCWNLHKSFLPHYRGMAPSFHALLEGAPTVGATLHLVDKGFDTGDILRQVEFPISATDSVYSLNRKTSQAGGELLASFLDAFDPRTVNASPQPEGNWKSYTYPSSREVAAFRRKGLRFYRPDVSPLVPTESTGLAH